jgi:DNA helicase HerA-like ATPase
MQKASSSSLNLAPSFSIPLEAATQTFAILAKRGSGKTYTALVMVEEMLKAGLQTVMVDPVGVCWGLRVAANGKDAGLPIVVLGGEHGDLRIEATSGAAIAEFVVEEGQSVVLDLSAFSGNEMIQFVTDFAETLYHVNSGYSDRYYSGYSDRF